jgi:hypothetical protein
MLLSGPGCLRTGAGSLRDYASPASDDLASGHRGRYQGDVHTLRCRGCHGDSAPNARPVRNARGKIDDPCPDPYAHAVTDRHGDRDAHEYEHGYAYPDRDADIDGHANRDGDADQHRNRDAHADGNGDGNSGTDCYCHTKPQPDGNRRARRTRLESVL